MYQPNSWFLEQLKLISPILSVRFVPCRGRAINGELYHGARYHSPSVYDPHLMKYQNFCERSPISQRYLCGGDTDPRKRRGRWIVERKVEVGAANRFPFGRIIKRLEMIISNPDGSFCYPSAKVLKEIRKVHEKGLIRFRRDVEQRNEQLLKELEQRRFVTEGAKWARMTDVGRQFYKDEARFKNNPLVGPSGRPIREGTEVMGREL